MLDGQIDLGDADQRVLDATSTPMLWAFPPNFSFGCTSLGNADRAIFDFDVVPMELTQELPGRGYYHVPLAPQDCNRVRRLYEIALSSMIHTTHLSALRQQSIALELSLLVLREVPARALSREQVARTKTDQALAIYAAHLADAPELGDIARNTHVSVAHLRRLFHEARGESPRTAFNRLRMQKAKVLLRETDLTLEAIASQVGLSSASALTRAIRVNFGRPPQSLRQALRRDSRSGSGESMPRKLNAPSKGTEATLDSA